jgi:hypothetical protein
MTSEGHGAIESEMLFRSSVVELAVLGALILTFVVSIYMLRRGHALTAANAPQADEETAHPAWGIAAIGASCTEHIPTRYHYSTVSNNRDDQARYPGRDKGHLFSAYRGGAGSSPHFGVSVLVADRTEASHGFGY